MGNLFGIRRRAPIVTAQDRAILQLKQQRDKIKIYQKKTEKDLEKNKDLALKLFQNGLKERALIVMRRKRNMEDILRRTDQQLATLEGLVADIEYTQIEVSVVEGLKVGSEALKQLTSLMDIDDIQMMMEDSAEAAEKQREICDILQRTSERYDEDDLLEELKAYETPPQPATTREEEEEEEDDRKTTLPDSIEVSESGGPRPELIIEVEPSLDSKIQELPDVPSQPPKEPELEETKQVQKKKTRQLELAE